MYWIYNLPLDNIFTAISHVRRKIPRVGESRSTKMACAVPAGLEATAISQTYSKMIVSPGAISTSSNSLYISYAPQTVASCNLYAYLPMWLQSHSSGDICFYEWYPNGMLDTNYAGNAYVPGWYKRWYFADVPRWDNLQYYCNGWSNYAYIYVYGPDHWINLTPHPEPGAKS